MTLKELSQLYHLTREVKMDKDRLEKLREKIAAPSIPKLTGMPSGGGEGDSLARYIAEIVDLEAIISAKLTQCMHERNRLERYIAGIPDSLTRQIFTLRFVDGLTWEECAARIGCGNTWKNLSNICYRYIKSTIFEN